MLSVVIMLALTIPQPLNYEAKVYCEEATGLAYGEPVEFKIRPIPFQDRRGDTLWLQPDAANDFLDLVELANAHGYEIKLNSAYRTKEHQMRLWKQMPDVAANPMNNGERTHQTGVSVDIAGTARFFSWAEVEKWEQENNKRMDVSHCMQVEGGYECPTMLYWWLNRFAKKFNFENDVPSERWHWTYTGPMKKARICRPNYKMVQAFSH